MILSDGSGGDGMVNGIISFVLGALFGLLVAACLAASRDD